MLRALLLASLLGATTSFANDLDRILDSVKFEKSNLEIKKPSVYLNAVKFRVSTEEDETGNFKKGGTDYGLRFYTNSFSEYRTKKKLIKNQEKRFKHSEAEWINHSLESIYHEYIDYVISRKIEKDHVDLGKVHKDKLRVFNTYIKRGEVDVTKLASAQQNYNKNRVKVLQLQHEGKSRKEKLSNLVNPKSALPETLLLKKIKQVISNSAKVPNEIVDIKAAELAIEAGQLSYDVEKSERNKIIDHVELGLKTQEREVGEDEKRVYINIAFNIPFFERRGSALNEKLIKKREVEYKEKVAKDKAAQAYQDILSQIRLGLKELSLLKNSEHIRQAKRIFRLLKGRSGESPLKKLAFKELLLNNEIQQKEITKDILKNYISLLRMKGILAKNPKRNFLRPENLKGVVI